MVTSRNEPQVGSEDRDRDHDPDLATHARRFANDPAYRAEVRRRVWQGMGVIDALMRGDRAEAALRRALEKSP